MAVLDAIFHLTDSDTTKIATLGTTTSSSATALAKRGLFAVSADGAYHIKLGLSGMGAADTGDFYVPSGVVMTLDMGSVNTHVRVYNPSASATINIYFAPLSRS